MSNKPQTQFKCPTVPPDHILVHSRWRGTKLGQELCQKHRGLYSEDTGLADFIPADNLAVLYFNDEDYVAGEHKKRIAAFSKLHKQNNSVVVADRNTETIAAYQAIQDYATFSQNLFMFPVTGPQDVPELLKDLAFVKCRNPDNPFALKPDEVDKANKQLTLLSVIPNVGRKTAQELLSKFGHIKAISSASEAELATRVGAATAKHVRKFFHDEHTVLTT